MSSTTPSNDNFLIDYIARQNEAIGPCLTAALACDGGGRNYHTHSKRFRNVLRDMKKQAATSDNDRKALEAILERAETLAGENAKWSGDYEGVCIHISGGGSELIRLRYPPVEMSMIGDHFSYRPAADALAARRGALVLHLSFKLPRLFSFDGESASVYGEIDLPESVYLFSETSAVDQGQRGHVRRSGVGSNVPNAPRIVSQGISRTRSPRELNEPVYLREVAQAMEGVEEARKLPLIVVGDDSIVGEFLKVYHHPAGEVERASLKNSHPSESDIAELASELEWKAQQREKKSILETLREEENRDASFSNNLREVYEAAMQGRVRNCVVACDENAWCRIGESGLLTSARPGEDPDAFDALDRIYTESLLRGGHAIVLPSSDIPGGKKVAAQLKW